MGRDNNGIAASKTYTFLQYTHVYFKYNILWAYGIKFIAQH